ncbi:cyclic nucleotide-binding domain-containing protein [Candidatus Bipolaricaulota bacterium]|nr:cyclic nucleotide-binding domain-containing protein [Candidatus Bipolaricaulota bacterium]
MDHTQAMDLLKATPLFGGVSGKGLRAILTAATERTYDADQKMVGEGDQGIGFYLILKGSVDVLKGGSKVAHLGTGAFFGEMSVLSGAPRNADVIAAEDTTCLILTSWALKSLIASHPDVAMEILQELIRRLRETESS